MTQIVYLDESGFTGNDLLNKDQPFFSYAAIAIDEQASKNIINFLRQKYSIKSCELKFNLINKRKNKKQIIIDIINKVGNKASVVCFDKKYGLCAKFFEYIMEPCISKYNSMFYSSGFHHFITYELYNELLTNKNPAIINLIQDFAKLVMENNKNSKTKDFFNKYGNISNIPDNYDFYNLLCYWISNNKNFINSEFKALSGDDAIDKYSLDFSYTALFTLCAEMSSRYGEIEVIYDKSKVLEAHSSIINSFVGKTLKFPCLNFLSGKKQHIINIVKPLIAENSKFSYSIQIADLIAGITNYAFKSNDHSLIKQLINLNILSILVSPQIHHQSIIQLYSEHYKQIFREIVINNFNNKNIIKDDLYVKLYALSVASNYLINKNIK